MHDLVVGTWAQINEGCPVTCTVSGSNVAHITFGRDPEFELGFEMEALRALTAVAAEAVADMDARFEREEAERATSAPAD